MVGHRPLEASILVPCPPLLELELGDRLMVGLWTLDPSIQVRILVSQLRLWQAGNPGPAGMK
ncbi:MAG: hypothetical protein UV02_C0022G0015 [Candidatus Kuenenbacteria bacterium GW2011_GWA2_42_15]|uniref:Uncharacterized protein n=1 Tax=Candidatus Kuenenbacteria bacterium GW2011_GWA2_42_15 TaxID=1618677 RepID=A0A0G0YZB7_9BACT|nr:MAG: hypothetical protein UV02_C0022G0015 [Candidatus Kuenenbacteria bacterium GW2011_GWA2_42_15]